MSVRTGSRLPIEECRHARSYKNDPHQWKYLCIEGKILLLPNTSSGIAFYIFCVWSKVKVLIPIFFFLSEPFDLTNTAHSVYDPDAFEKIKKAFSYSFGALKETRSLASIFTKSESESK